MYSSAAGQSRRTGPLAETRRTLHRFACGFADSHRPHNIYIYIFKACKHSLLTAEYAACLKCSQGQSPALFGALCGRRERRGGRQGGNKLTQALQKVWGNGAARASSLTAQGHLRRFRRLRALLAMKRTCESQDCPETVGMRVVAVTGTGRTATEVC